MNVCSFWMLLVIGIATVVFHLAPSQRLRRFVLICLNLEFFSYFVDNVQSCVFLAAFLLGAYGMLRLLKSRPSRARLLGCLAMLVLAFVYLKRYEFLDYLLPMAELRPSCTLKGVELVGLSYILFKAIHMAVDQWQGQLAPYNLLSYLNYQLAFFTLIAGPIQRYNDFHEAWGRMDEGAGDVRETIRDWNRILTGVVQMGVVSVLLDYAITNLVVRLGDSNAASADLWPCLAGRFYLYPIYLYFNFAGYTNIAIGCAGLFGFRVPENFNYPFAARNMIDYWNRWHITLSHWIRDYVFMTSYKFCAERFPAWNRWSAYFLLFFALFLAGVWHGSALHFALYGAVHGAGVVGTQIYGDLLRKRLGRSGFQQYLQNHGIHSLAVVVTFHYFCFSCMFFASDCSIIWSQLRSGIAALGSLQGAGAAMAGTVLPAVFLWTLIAAGIAWWDRGTLASFVNAVRSRIPRSPGPLFTALFAKAALTSFVLLIVWALQQSDPVVVYMRF